jgi:hypothetical protein
MAVVGPARKPRRRERRLIATRSPRGWALRARRRVYRHTAGRLERFFHWSQFDPVVFAFVPDP